MAIYRSIRITFWTDSKIADDFTPEDKYFYLYLFTNPHTNLAGCYELSIKQASVELGYDTAAIKALLRRFDETHHVIKYSKRTKEVLIINWHKYNWTGSEKFRKPLEDEIMQIKEEAFRDYLLSVFNGVDTVSIPYQYGSDTTVTVTVTDTVKNNNKKEVKERNIIPPSRAMVSDYIFNNSLNVNIDDFMDFYDSKGWLVGKSKMKDWQATLRRWSREQANKKQSKTHVNPFTEMLEKGEF